MGALRAGSTPVLLAIAAVLSAIVASRADAQRDDAMRAGVIRRVPSAYAPLVSAIVPGGGQLMQRKDRSLVYAAVEVLAWWKFSLDVADRERRANEYKDLARRVARAHFSPDGPDSEWSYYEHMRDWTESGDFSQSDATLTPESDPNTFNGDRWVKDSATSATRAEALTKYASEAIRPELQWSWRNAGLQFDQFKRATEARNAANAAAQLDLTVIVLNHLISMVDAFSVFRLETHRQADGRTAIGGSVRW